jgi:hypothetical protein
MKRLAVITSVVLLSALNLSVAAHPHHLQRQASAGAGCLPDNEGRMNCGPVGRAASQQVATAGLRTIVVDDGEVIGSRPEGCPHAYCGCGLRKYLGLDDKRLNLASNWAKYFPHESGPAAGLAAVRGGHVMYIEAAAGNGLWMIRDYNSGGGLSRLHIRDVRGYVFVNPRGAERLTVRDEGSSPRKRTQSRPGSRLAASM